MKRCGYIAGLRPGHGDAETVVEQYVAQMEHDASRRHTPEAQPSRPTSTGIALRVNENRFGSMELEIVAVHLRDQAGCLIAELESGVPCVSTSNTLPPPH